ESGGHTDSTTSLAPATAASVPRSSRPAARARRRVASLRPAEAHTTRVPPWRRHSPTTDPISPGCTNPTVLAIRSPPGSGARRVTPHPSRYCNTRTAQRRRWRCQDIARTARLWIRASPLPLVLTARDVPGTPRVSVGVSSPASPTFAFTLGHRDVPERRIRLTLWCALHSVTISGSVVDKACALFTSLAKGGR